MLACQLELAMYVSSLLARTHLALWALVLVTVALGWARRSPKQASWSVQACLCLHEWKHFSH